MAWEREIRYPAHNLGATSVVTSFEVEVDVVQDRSTRPWRTRTHYVTVVVEDRPSWSSMEIEARNMAAFMCWGVRGESVDGVRIVGCEE